MIKRIFVLMFLVIAVSLNAQDILNFENSQLVIPSSEKQGVESDSFYEYVLYIHSSHRCGYCRELRRSLMEIQLTNLKIVFLEYDTSESSILDERLTYNGNEVRRIEEFEREDIKMFPHSQLVDISEGKIVKEIRGYRDNYWKKIFRIVD